MKKLQKGFTLVELIVVITILAILGTIAFISLQGYSQDARDSKVASDVRTITSAIATTVTKGTPIGSLVIDAGTGSRDINGVNNATNRYSGTGVFAGTLALSGALIQTGDINFTTLRQNGSDYGATTYKIATMSHMSGSGNTTKAWNVYQIVGSKGVAPNRTALIKGNYLQGNGVNGILGLMSATGTTGDASGLTEGLILPIGL